MSLENTVAKYEVSITRTGQGAIQAAQEFSQVDQAARSASSSADATTVAFDKLRESHLLGRDALHALNGVILLTGGTHLPMLNLAVLSLHGSLNLLKGMAQATGASMASLSAGAAGVVVAAATMGAMLALSKDIGKETESYVNLMEQAAALAKKTREELEQYRSLGLLSYEQMRDFERVLNKVTPERVNVIQRELLKTGYSAGAVADALKFRDLQRQIAEDALGQYDKERAKEGQLYSDRVNHLNALANANRLISPNDLNAALNTAGSAYSTAVNATNAKENAEKLKDAQDTLELEITMAVLNGSHDREGFYQREFDYRVNTYKQLRQLGVMSEAEYSQAYVEAAVKRQAEAAAAEQSALAARQAETDAMLKDFNQQEQLYALSSRDSKKQIAAQELQDRLDFDANLYFDYRITLDKMDELDNDARIKHLQALQSMEKQEHIHLMTVEQMEGQAANSFSSGLASAIVEFANGTKSAQQAFSEFAASFLSDIAKMILQQMVLNTLKSMFFAGGGTALAAQGGFYPTYAASGLEGVHSVSQATYFPRFNVVAGEAGREMLTVLARPRFMDIGGVEAVVGQAGRNTLAIASANQLANRAGTAGHLVIEISHSEQSKAEIISQAIQGAEIRVTQQAGRNSRLRSALKKVGPR